MKNQKGFTLIELLIVIGIIAILAAAVIVAINPGEQFKQARNATRQSHLNSIVNGVYSYAIDNDGSFPDCDGSTTAGTLDTAERDLAHCGSLTTTYMAELPMDPSDGGATNDYCYDTEDSGVDATDCTGYTIKCDSDTSCTRITITSVSDEFTDTITQ